MGKWFAFRAYNEQTLYGFGTEADAERYCEHLNADREINVYGAYALGKAEAAELRVEDNIEAFSIDDALAGVAGIR